MRGEDCIILRNLFVQLMNREILFLDFECFEIRLWLSFMLLMICLKSDHGCLLYSSLEVLAISELYMLCILLVIKYIIVEDAAEKWPLHLPLLSLCD